MQKSQDVLAVRVYLKEIAALAVGAQTLYSHDSVTVIF
jgi:hypothetical protein